MMIDPTKHPRPLAPVPSQEAAPFAAILRHPSLRPWGERVRDLGDPEFLRAAEALSMDEPVRMPDGRLDAIKAMRNVILPDLVVERSMVAAVRRGVTDFSPALHMDHSLLTDPEIWQDAFREASYAALRHTMEDDGLVCVSVDQATWERRSTGSHPVVDSEGSSLISLAFPALIMGPTFSDGTPMKLFWVRSQSASRLQVTAFGPFGDADDRIAMTSLDVDSATGSDEGAVRRSALMRGGGDALVPHGWVESAVRLIPWLNGLAQVHLQLDLRRCGIDLTLRTREMPEVPAIVDPSALAGIDPSFGGRVLPVAVDRP